MVHLKMAAIGIGDSCFENPRVALGEPFVKLGEVRLKKHGVLGVEEWVIIQLVHIQKIKVFGFIRSFLEP